MGESDRAMAAEEPVVAEPMEEDQEETLPPRRTIYVNNLNERVKGEALKVVLRTIFKQFGEILEIVSMDSVRRRGQAFVVFESLDSAKEAKEKMQGFPIYDKPIKIAFAKKESDILARREGLAIPTPEERKAQRVQQWAEEKKNPKKPKIEVAAAPTNGVPVGYGGAAPAAVRTSVEPTLPLDMQTPNKTLFVQNLPDETDEMTIYNLFHACQGFQQVRMVPGRMGICFVDFEVESQAGSAMHACQGYQMSPQHSLVISFAKK